MKVTTWHNDNAHTGQNIHESSLTLANVNSATFGKLGSFAVDGQVYAQPLYWHGLNIPRVGARNVVFVATENDSVYAFNAEKPGSKPVWQVSFANPPNVVPVPCGDIDSSCHVRPVVGITGTPVIDASTQTLYVIARTKEIQGKTANYVQRLHALDLATGAEKFGGPVAISATANSIAFDPRRAGQRPGLLLVPSSGGANSILYIAWAGYTHDGLPLLPGWVMAYNTQTLQQVAAFATTNSSGTDGGIWGSGGGMVADSSGNIYAATGDGTFDANTKGGSNYGNTLLKLKLSGDALTVADYFTPMDQACRLQYDFDLGSGGPIILPRDPKAQITDEILISGKGGTPCDPFGPNFASPIYVINRKQMSHYHPKGDKAVQIVAGSAGGYWSDPAFWQGANAAYVYYAGVLQDARLGVGDNLRMYTISAGVMSSTSVAQSPQTFAVGVTPSVSSNGTSNGIAWVIERQNGLSKKLQDLPAVLHAFDATNVATELYNSAQAGTRDQAGLAVKFAVPVVADGKVFVGTQTELDIYGLLK